MKLGEYQKVKVILWPWSKVTLISKFKLVFLKNRWAIWNQSSLRFQSSNLFFSKTVGQFGTKVHMKAWRRIDMKINTNELGHMTKMATMPIYGKNLKKSSSPEPIDQWPWNLVCSIVYVSTTKIVQIISLGWPWPILRQGQIWSHRLLYGKKWKLFIFSSPEHKVLKVSYCDHPVSGVSRPSCVVNNSFKAHLLLNYWTNFKIISQKCSPEAPLPKLLKWFRSAEQNGRQS